MWECGTCRQNEKIRKHEKKKKKLRCTISASASTSPLQWEGGCRQNMKHKKASRKKEKKSNIPLLQVACEQGDMGPAERA
jgi:hypothetical protein